MPDGSLMNEWRISLVKGRVLAQAAAAQTIEPGAAVCSAAGVPVFRRIDNSTDYSEAGACSTNGKCRETRIQGCRTRCR